MMTVMAVNLYNGSNKWEWCKVSTFTQEQSFTIIISLYFYWEENIVLCNNYLKVLVIVTSFCPSFLDT